MSTVVSAPVVSAGVAPIDLSAWKARSRSKERKAELKREQVREIETELLAPVGELVAKITAFGLPGEPHPQRLLPNGIMAKQCGRSKQREAFRRGERAQLLEELKNLPIDEPLPIALTAKARQILAKRKGVMA